MGKGKELGDTSIDDITDPREQARYKAAAIVETEEVVDENGNKKVVKKVHKVLHI